VSYDLQPWVVGGGDAKPSNTEKEVFDGRTLLPPLTSNDQAKIQVILIQSHCATRPATRSNSGPIWTLELHSGTRTFVLLAQKQYLRRCLISQSFLTYPIRGHSMARQTTPRCLGSLPAPQCTMSTPSRRVQTALGTIS